jgi:hypothetical protein
MTGRRVVERVCCSCEACKGWEQDPEHCMGDGRRWVQVYRWDGDGYTTRLGVDERPLLAGEGL